MSHVTTGLLRRRLLLAGSVGPERVPVRPDSGQARWFEPPHIRDESSAMARLASQVGAGADVVVAPTWLTHRRALLPVGETRQARAWTAAAVRVARQAIEMGLEQREEALAAMAYDDRDGVELWRTRATPLVAAVLPSLVEGAESETGRLLPREAATERDYRDQAGLLADAEPDLIVVEGQGTLPEVHAALDEAIATGITTWLALSGLERASGGMDRAQDEAAFDVARAAGVARWLIPPPPRRLPTDSELDWGGLLGLADIDAAASPTAVEGKAAVGEAAPGDATSSDPTSSAARSGAAATWPAAGASDPTSSAAGSGAAAAWLAAGAGDPTSSAAGSGAAAAWLAAGAGALALLDGATPARLQRIRKAIDDHERAEVEALSQAERRWWTHVRLAASMAPGGAALYVASAPANESTIERASGPASDRAARPAGIAGAAALPGGFDWIVVGREGARGLPEGHFRLVVDAVGGRDAHSRWGPLLEHGGILALPLADALPGFGLRALLVDDAQEPPLAIFRRES